MLELDNSFGIKDEAAGPDLDNLDLCLRNPDSGDLCQMVAMASNPILNRTICFGWLPFTRDMAKNWLEAPEKDPNSTSREQIFVISGQNNTFAGFACLNHDLESREAEISLIIRQAMWNRGIATLAAQILIDAVFSTTNSSLKNMKAITARCRASCNKSRRVMEKCGFQYSGTGMTYSRHCKGIIPVDHFRLDRGIWKSLTNWRKANSRCPDLSVQFKARTPETERAERDSTRSLVNESWKGAA